MATLVSHSWNEVQLMPLWLAHHVPMFDEVIVLDFDSDDGTRDLIRDSGATLVDAGLPDFCSEQLDARVEEIEARIEGPRITLNTTEFLLGDPSKVSRELFVPQISLVNMADDAEFDWSRQFFEQRRFGISFERDFMRRRSRRFSLVPKKYPLGRHFMVVDADGFIIVHVAYCYVNQAMIDRRLAIQHRIPARDKELMLGYQHHNWGRGLTLEDVLEEERRDRQAAEDLSRFL